MGNAIPFNFAKTIYLGENIEDECKNEIIEIAKEQQLKVIKDNLIE